jgi:hypothetical protein
MEGQQIASVIAYTGPAHCGKADVINHIYRSIPVEQRRDPPVPRPPRTGGEGFILSVDIVPPWLEPIAGRPLTFRLGTVPGRVFEEAARRELLAAADAFVVVIDARPQRIEATIESAENLVFGLEQAGRSIDDQLLAVQLQVEGGTLDGLSRAGIEGIIDRLPLPRQGVRLYPADPRTGQGCDLAFKDIATRKHAQLTALVERGILEPA